MNLKKEEFVTAVVVRFKTFGVLSFVFLASSCQYFEVSGCLHFQDQSIQGLEGVTIPQDVENPLTNGTSQQHRRLESS
jgi:hypothetical protein